MSMLGASYRECPKCGAKIDSDAKKCPKCGETGFKRSLKYCEMCSSPAEMTELECKVCGGSSFIHSKPTIEYCSCPKPLINGQECARCKRELSPARVALILAPDKSSKSEKNFDDLIEAQNRTTHAVRAFVRFLFIQLSGITLTVFVWNASNLFINQQECVNYGRQCSGNGFLRFLAVVIWLISVFLSSHEGWKELDKSKID